MNAEVTALERAGSDWRARLLSRMAAERAGFLQQLLGLDEAALVSEPVLDSWTPKDLMAHVAAWDDHFAGRIEQILVGHEDEVVGVDVDEQNAIFYAERKALPLAQAIGALGLARAGLLAALSSLSDDEAQHQRSFPWGEASVALWAQWAYEHDEEHGQHVRAWRKERDLGWHVGPKSLLLAAQASAHQEILVAAALVPPDERTTRPVCGAWSLRDLLGHVADWELFCVEALRLFFAGETDRVIHDGDILTWNDVKAAVRQDQPWEQVWADFQQAHREVAALLQRTSQADLARPLPNPWDAKSTVYSWLTIFVGHEHEHAHDLRRAMGM